MSSKSCFLLFLLILSAGLSHYSGYSDQSQTGGASAGETNSIPPFMVGIADRNGILVPFAVYENKTWTSSWPVRWYDGKYQKPDTLYASLSEIPPSWYRPLPDIPEKWYCFSPEGGSFEMTTIRPALVFCQCDQRWALISASTKKENVGAIGDFFRLSHDLFIALSSDHPVEHVITVEEGTEEWRKLAAYIEPVLTVAEDEVNHPVPKNERAEADLKFFNLARNESPHEGYYMYYVEVKKEYRSSEQNKCISYLQGWIVKDTNGDVTFLEKKFAVYSEEMFYMLGDIPLGIISVGREMYWIMRNQGYESEEYLLIKVSESGVRTLIKVYGGGC